MHIYIWGYSISDEEVGRNSSSSNTRTMLLLLLLAPIAYISYHILPSLVKKKPTTHGGSLLGHVLWFLKNRHRFLDWSTELIVGSPELRTGLWIPGMISGLITGNPADVEHILRTNFANYPKGEPTITLMKDFLGHGIFNSDGDQWLWQRKSVSLEFSTRSLRGFLVDSVQDEVRNRLLPLLRRAAAGAGVVLDMQDVLERFAFDTICVVSFGHDPCCLADGGVLPDRKSDFLRAFGEAQDLTANRWMELTWIWKLKRWLRVGNERRLRKAIADVHGFAMDIVRARRKGQVGSSAGNNRDDDLLSRLVASGDHGDEALRDIVLSFLLAGRETTSSALTWFFWLVSSRPDVVARVADEVRSVRSVTATAPGDPFTLDALRGMPYLHAALTESMRLYPPVAIDSVTCATDDTLPDGSHVGAGWCVMYSAYAMGRLAAIWGDDCAEFKPERWLDDDGAFRPMSPFRYTVFHAGPRTCLGKEMAYIQMKSIVASVLEEFVINVVDDNDGSSVPEHMLSLTLRMKAGLPVQIRIR